MPLIGANASGVVEFFLFAKQRSNFDNNIFDIQIRDNKKQIIYNAGFKVPVKQN